MIRAHRIPLISWLAGLLILCAATVSAIAEYYSDPAARGGYAASMDVAPMFTAISGSGTGLTHLGGIMANELAIILFTGLALAAIFISTALTRGDEDAGRMELVTSRPVPRARPLAQAMGITTGFMILVSLGIVAAMAGFGADMDHMLGLYGASVLAYGLFFAGMGFLAAQIAGNTTTARQIGLAAFAVFYMIRISVNATGSSLWWASPLGWFDHVEPYGAGRLLPLVLLIATATFLYGAAWVIHGQRDIGTGLITFATGSPRAPRWLMTAPGYLLRQCQTTLIIWILLAIGTGALMGGLVESWLEVMQLNLESVAAFGFSASPNSISQLVGLVAALFGAATGITIISRFRTEEASTRLSLVLSRPLTYTRLWRATIVIALASALLITALTLGTYIATAALTGSSVAETSLAAYLVPPLVLTGLAASLHVHLSVHLAWFAYAYAALMVFLGPILKPPQIFLDLSPINAIGQVPVASVNTTAIIIQLALTAVFVGLAQKIRRDLP